MTTKEMRIQAETALINTVMGASGGLLIVLFLVRFHNPFDKMAGSWNYTEALNGALNGAISQVISNL